MQKVLQHLPAAQASTALALGWIVNVQARPCAFGPGLCGPGQGSPRQAAGCGRWHLRRVHESLPALVPHIARGQAAHHAVLGPFPPGHALVCAPAGHAAGSTKAFTPSSTCRHILPQMPCAGSNLRKNRQFFPAHAGRMISRSPLWAATALRHWPNQPESWQ